MMKVTMYWYPKCGTCRNAKRWLEETVYEVDSIHIVEQTPDRNAARLSEEKWFGYKEMV